MTKTKIAAQSFYANLERLLKRFSPARYLPAAAQILKDSVNDPNKMRIWPLHFALHFMEANYSYHRKQDDDLVLLFSPNA